MIKKAIIVFILLLGNFSLAQNRSAIDSLFQVKDFLLDIRSTVNVKDWNGAQQLIKVEQLIEKGQSYETQFPLWLKTVIREDSWHSTEMKRQFTLILQTLALYKSDLIMLQNKRPTNQEELEYLNRKIPKLVDTIYYYCKLAEEERLKKIH